MSIINFKKFLAVMCLIMSGTLTSFAENNAASAEFSFNIPEYVRIEPMTSPVLVANITDRTGNLAAPLSSGFKVVTNSAEAKTLYLKANTVTQGGYEEAMFERGGVVYIAFANLAKIPKSSSLAKCKAGADAQDSPGVVAYPVTSVSGAKSKFNKNKNKYEVTVENGTTYVTVNIGSSVLRTSFAANDPKGFYQAVLSLTEADI